MWILQLILLAFLVTQSSGLFIGCVGNPCEQICIDTLVIGYKCSCHPGFSVNPRDSSKCIAIPKPKVCDRGFQPNSAGQCVDINECANTANPPCQQQCSNSQGSYECSCNAGYVINEYDPSKCDKYSSGGGTSQCGQGFRPSASDPRECEDVNECTEIRPCEQDCFNSRGSYECSCRSGYVISEYDSSRCISISTNNCGVGFKPSEADPRECEDIDECKSNAHSCQQVCKNTRGSYTCSCDPGFAVIAKDPFKCEAVNPCKSSPCEHICTASGAKYTCSCRSGYRVNDVTKCVDINECSNSPSPCQHTCTNQNGGYTCSCDPGFVVSSSDSSKCQAADYCASNPCQHTCASTATGYKCSCKKGYAVSKTDATKCEDIDECTASTKPCQQTCTNTAGSFKCSCKSGFEVSSADKTKCNAATSTDPCKTGAICEHDCVVLTTGGRKCTCRSGYAVSSEDETLCDKISICTSTADVVMVFDASNSIGVEHFDKQFIFAKKLIRNFKIGPKDVLFSSVVYSRAVLTLFNLKDHNDYDSLDKALTGVKYMNSTTETGLALNHVRDTKMYDAVNGGRENAPNILVLFTDGDPRYLDDALAAAKSLKNDNVLIIGVGIGSGLNMDIVRQLSSSPEDALEATSYDTLEYIEKRLTELLCTRRA